MILILFLIYSLHILKVWRFEAIATFSCILNPKPSIRLNFCGRAKILPDRFWIPPRSDQKIMEANNLKANSRTYMSSFLHTHKPNHLAVGEYIKTEHPAGINPGVKWSDPFLCPGCQPPVWERGWVPLRRPVTSGTWGDTRHCSTRRLAARDLVPGTKSSDDEGKLRGWHGQHGPNQQEHTAS